MAGSTNPDGYPYPSLSDPPDVPADIKNLADAVQSKVALKTHNHDTTYSKAAHTHGRADFSNVEFHVYAGTPNTAGRMSLPHDLGYAANGCVVTAVGTSQDIVGIVCTTMPGYFTSTYVGCKFAYVSGNLVTGTLTVCYIVW